MTTPAEPEPQPRDIRASGRDRRLFAGTDGAPGVTSGEEPMRPLRAAPLIAALLAITGAANVFSHLHDTAAAGLALPAWQPITWEATSAVSDFAACWIIWLALRVAPPSGRRWPRFLLIHAVATVAFSAVHVAGMWALRKIIYATVGAHYSPAFSEALYEYRKDILAYMGFGALLWLGPRLAFPPRTAAAVGPGSPSQACFDIQDGPRILRIPVGEILAVHAAGNYVEFLLQDGRRPLMRAPIGEIAASLEPSGFLRTHRSWVVNLARVRALEPAGSGDYQIALDGGDSAPVSRRFPEAVERLKARP